MSTEGPIYYVAPRNTATRVRTTLGGNVRTVFTSCLGPTVPYILIQSGNILNPFPSTLAFSGDELLGIRVGWFFVTARGLFRVRNMKKKKNGEYFGEVRWNYYTISAECPASSM